MKAPHLLLLLALTACQPEPIPRWSEASVYVEVVPTFLPHDYPEIEQRVRGSLDLLETGINSENFKRFVMEGDLNEDNREAYERFMGSDLHMTIQITQEYPNIQGFHVNKDNIIFVHDDARFESTSIHRMAAIMGHEYGHTIGFHHKPEDGSTVRSFSYYLQISGEGFFRYVHRNISHYPRKGQWLFLY